MIRRFYWAEKVNSSLVKRCDYHLWLQGHLIKLPGSPHVLALITSPCILSNIFFESRIVVFGCQNLVGCSLYCKMTSIWFIVTCSKDVISFFFSHTSVSNLIWFGVEHQSKCPGAIETLFHQEMMLIGWKVWWCSSYSKVIFYICEPWVINFYWK